MAGTWKTVGTTCTTLKAQPAYVDLPPGTEGYIGEKVKYALMAPDVVNIKLPDGSDSIITLKQIVMTGMIRLDEAKAKFHWQYKAEVNFDMTRAKISGGRSAPIPFLSSHVEDGPGRRHSLSPFPPGWKPTYLRRPDVIIVERPEDRWPGRSTIDREGNPHVDNSLRVVEIKFPGDVLSKDQEEAYQQIAGKPDEAMRRMTVIDVSDCDGELEKARQRSLAMSPAEREAELREKRRARKLRAPIRSIEPIAEPAWYEAWIRHASDLGDVAIAAVWDVLNSGANYLSEEMETWLRQHAPWVLTAGSWVVDAAGATWRWVDKTGHEIARYTSAQLKAAWQAIAHETDLTWEQLKQINWSQIGTSIIDHRVAIAAVIAGVVVAVVLSEIWVPALLALAGIVATAPAAALAALAAVVGVSAAASA